MYRRYFAKNDAVAEFWKLSDSSEEMTEYLKSLSDTELKSVIKDFANEKKTGTPLNNSEEKKWKRLWSEANRRESIDTDNLHREVDDMIDSDNDDYDNSDVDSEKETNHRKLSYRRLNIRN